MKSYFSNEFYEQAYKINKPTHKKKRESEKNCCKNLLYLRNRNNNLLLNVVKILTAIKSYCKLSMFEYYSHISKFQFNNLFLSYFIISICFYCSFFPLVFSYLILTKNFCVQTFQYAHWLWRKIFAFIVSNSKEVSNSETEIYWVFWPMAKKSQK